MISNVYMSHIGEFAPPGDDDPESQKLLQEARPMFEEGAAVARDDWTNGKDSGSRMGGLMAEMTNFAEFPPESFAPSDEE